MRGLLGLWGRRARDRELAAEMAAHIAEQADELVESGMRRDEALRAARARFGNLTAVAEQSREVWGLPVVEGLWRDLRLGARALRRQPLFTVVAAGTLALGIGANTTIFSLVDAVLLRPLPFPESDRIAMLWEHPPRRGAAAPGEQQERQNPTSPMNFLDWRAHTRSFEDMAALDGFPMGLSGPGGPRAVAALEVSAAFFRILGVRPLLGRTFDTSEDVPGGPRLVVLGYGLWRREFGSDPGVVGRTVRLLDEPYQVIGVMPRDFDLPFAQAELWVPIQIAAGAHAGGGRYLSVIAKLKPGITAAQAETDLMAAERQIARERPRFNLDWSAGVVSLYQQTTGEVRAALLLLFGAVAFVLLIAAANVSNLLLMRGSGRRREMALRAALGAGRARLAAQLMAESLLLSVCGGALGVALAWLGLRGMLTALPAFAWPRLDGAHLDARVLAFSLALSLAATFLFGLVPALWISRGGPHEALQQGNPRGSVRGGRMSRLLVVTEVALSLVLLAGAGLLARSFLNQVRAGFGFRTDHILTLRLFLAPARYGDLDRRAAYIGGILARVRALPGVEAASSAHFLPLTGETSGSGFRRLDRAAPDPAHQTGAEFLVVSPQYFSVMGIPLLAGRDFNEYDTPRGEPGVIVNQAFARRYFAGENPLGKRLGLDWNVRHGEIIGVAADARHAGPKVPPQPTIFLDQAQTPMYFAALVVRTSLPPERMARAVQDAVHAVDSDQAISEVESMDQVVSDAVARPRLESLLLGVFAGMALALAVIGLYGVLAYTVAQRTREIGIRMALGAHASQLVRAVVRDGLTLVVFGVCAGVPAALGLTRLLGSLLYGVEATDAVTFAVVCAVLLVVGAGAAWLPARRAAAVDPVTSLRWE